MPMGMINGGNGDKEIPLSQPCPAENMPPKKDQNISGAVEEISSFMGYVKQTLFDSEFFEARGSLVSNSSGRIKHMLLQYNSRFMDINRHDLLKAYKILITEMEPDTKFTVIVRDNADAARLEKFIKEQIKPVNPDRIKIIAADARISIWARDLIISVLSDENQLKVILPQSEMDIHINEQKVIENSGLRYDYSPLIIDGGNMQKDKEGNIWIGYDSIKNSALKLFMEIPEDKELKNYFKRYYKKYIGKDLPEDFRLCKKEIIKELEEKIIPEMIKRQFKLSKDKELYVIGKDNPETIDFKEDQPSFHIDMAITPLGSKTVIIGDPELAMNIIKDNKAQCLEDGKKMWEEQLNGKSPKFDGFYAAEMVKSGPQIGSDINIVDALMSENSKLDLKMNFNQTVKEFEDKGFKAIRIPYLQGNAPKDWVGPTILPFITYNNCIIEEYINDKGEKIKKVYLPQYGISALDNFACDTFEKIGYKVVKIPSMALISKNCGSIHCLVNDLERTEK